MTAGLHEASSTPDPDAGGTPAGLPIDEATTYLAVLARLAALEGLAAPERAFLDRVVGSLGIDPALLGGEDEHLAGSAVPTATLVERLPDPGARLRLLRDAYRLAAVDEDVSDTEIRELSTIVGALGLAHGLAAAVRNVALQESRLEREFARLVQEARTDRLAMRGST